MSLARRSLLAQSSLLASSRRALAIQPQRRCASTSNTHHDEHHGEHHDSTQYPKESFGGPIWRATILVSLLGVAAYKYLPEPADNVYLTRWIALYDAPRDFWLNLNAKHAAQQEQASDAMILFSDAKMPQVHRYRYPQVFEQASPFINAVGSNVDMSGVVVRGDHT